MTAEPLGRFVQNLRRSLDAAQFNEASDSDLLERFRDAHDSAALEAIVNRHGPRVLAACRKVLSGESDVEDVFQATFIVLMRGPKAVRQGSSLGAWLYGVAHRIALQVRAKHAHRERLEKKARTASMTQSADLSWREACAVLHEELDRLPDSYRLPLMLCYLEGLSRDEAATSLGVSLNVVKKRLETGRLAAREEYTTKSAPRLS